MEPIEENPPAGVLETPAEPPLLPETEPPAADTAEARLLAMIEAIV